MVKVTTDPRFRDAPWTHKAQDGTLSREDLGKLLQKILCFDLKPPSSSSSSSSSK